MTEYRNYVINSIFYSALMLGCFLFFNRCTSGSSPANPHDWPHYLGDPGSNQFSQLSQINADNVHTLQVAWEYQSGDADTSNRSQIQCNPLVIGGTLYGTSAGLKLFALDASTGEEKWVFDPFSGNFEMFGMGVNRGVCYWRKGKKERILFCAGEHLYSVDANTGRPDNQFGLRGKVDLHIGLGEEARDLFVVSNSPGVVYRDIIIIGSRVSEAMGAAPGHIRAIQIETGELAWIFHTIPKGKEYGYQTWPKESLSKVGGANAWSGMSVDHKRGMVFIPTGSAAYDFYGGDRHGKNLFANCLLALDAKTGKRIWHYQFVHHDLWDRDLPAPPNLVTINVDGKTVDAVAQITKSAFVFVFDRETGVPLFPIEEIPVPESTLEGEEAWPYQPIPSKPPAFSRQTMLENDITNRSKEAHEYVKSIWKNLKVTHQFDPPSEEGTVLIPGFDGGGEWGGAAVDQDGIMYINASEMPWIIQMIRYEEETNGLLATKGKNIYSTQCLICHGKDRQGASINSIPSLVDVGSRLANAEIRTRIQQGKGVMPSFKHLSDQDVDAVIAYLTGSEEAMPEEKEATPSNGSLWNYPYFMNGYVRFKDHEGFPAITPPWGTLNAIDLNAGEIKWKVTLGAHPDLPSFHDKPTGCENYGGPVVTAGNVLIIAATLDEKIRAFNKEDGRLLWEAPLPAAGYATPATYMINNKQYIVIGCGGGKLDTKSGDSYIAFALP